MVCFPNYILQKKLLCFNLIIDKNGHLDHQKFHCLNVLVNKKVIFNPFLFVKQYYNF